VGTDYEHDSLLNLAKLVDEGERHGIPVMAVTAVGRELEKRDDRYLALACRIAAELGARVVKTYYCEKFEKVTGSCPVPVVIAGGPKVPTGYEVLQFVYDGIQKGAIGVNLGRNIWQDDHPVAMIRALRAIIHENATAEQAQKLYDSVKSAKAWNPYRQASMPGLQEIPNTKHQILDDTKAQNTNYQKAVDSEFGLGLRPEGKISCV
jgi:3-hydroxy-5-phosphonooxypentane-2,4-dione thiolase